MLNKEVKNFFSPHTHDIDGEESRKYILITTVKQRTMSRKIDNVLAIKSNLWNSRNSSDATEWKRSPNSFYRRRIASFFMSVAPPNHHPSFMFKLIKHFFALFYKHAVCSSTHSSLEFRQCLLFACRFMVNFLWCTSVTRWVLVVYRRMVSCYFFFGFSLL